MDLLPETDLSLMLLLYPGFTACLCNIKLMLLDLEVLFLSEASSTLIEIFRGSLFIKQFENCRISEMLYPVGVI